MASTTGIAGLTRPAEEARPTTGAAHRSFGITLAVIGWLAGMAGLVISISTAVAAALGAPAAQVAALEAIGFGIAIAALGTAKTGIALVLWGIVRRIWVRVGSLKAALPSLVTVAPERPQVLGAIRTPHGAATTSASAPAPLFIHRMARTMWAPMLLMGVMALYAGLVVSIIQSQNEATNAALARSLKAWVQGLQFLGEGFLLSAISFFLGTILGAIRAGGGEVQQSLGVTVHTLKMPATAKVFVTIMMLGLMVEIAQFVLYVYVASLSDAKTIATWSTWLGPFREFGLGVLLSGIVFALATIAKALDFQFSRVRDLIRNGR